MKYEVVYSVGTKSEKIKEIIESPEKNARYTLSKKYPNEFITIFSYKQINNY